MKKTHFKLNLNSYFYIFKGRHGNNINIHWMVSVGKMWFSLPNVLVEASENLFPSSSWFQTKFEKIWLVGRYALN